MTDMELEQFITEYGTDIYSFCCCLAGSRQEADDLYQETFLRAVEKKKILDAAGNPKSYLLSVAVRVWNNQRRKAAWRKRLAYVEPILEKESESAEWKGKEEDQPEIQVVRNEMRREIQKAVSNLPDKLKVVVLLHYMEDRSVQQMAGILHIPQGTVKSRLYHARKILQRELEYMRYE